MKEFKPEKSAGLVFCTQRHDREKPGVEWKRNVIDAQEPVTLVTNTLHRSFRDLRVSITVLRWRRIEMLNIGG